MPTSNRNYGVDLLRIVSMIMVLILHILLQSEMLKTFSPSSPQYFGVYFLEIASYCAVNCYALISGFTGYGRKFKPSGIIFLWFQVVFYTVGLSLIFKLISPDSVNLFRIVSSVFPVSFNLYWYFTSYFVLFFFAPILNCIVEKLSRKALTTLIIIVVFLFSIFPILGDAFIGDIFAVKYGYSPLWLAVLYLIGAFIKKHHFGFKQRKWVWIVIYLVSVVITLISNLLVSILSNRIGILVLFKEFLMSYNSPTILLCGISLFVLFAGMDLSPGFCKAVSFFSASAFAVYIIHLYPNIWNILSWFSVYSKLNIVLLVLAVVGTAFAIWLVCSLVDKLRQILFKLIKINVLSEKIALLAQRLMDKVVNGLYKLMD